MLSEWLLYFGIALIIYAIYKWTTQNDDYFAKRNLPFAPSGFMFRNMLVVFRSTLPELAQQLYNSFPNEKMNGFFQFRTPFVVIRDPELLKQLAVKDFDHFVDHGPFVDDDLFGNSLFQMKGQRWRDMRATMSPAFTGSKMRQMFELVTECADEMAKYFVRLSASGEQIDMEMKDLFSRYTADVVATCAFGIRVNSFEDPNNEFFVSGSKFADFTSLTAIFKFLFINLMPSVARKLDVQLVSSTMSEFFTRIILNTMDERRKRGIVRHDMINILMKVRQGKLNAETDADQTENAQRDNAGFAAVEESDVGRQVSKHQWSDTELIAQAFIFFIAGFDTTSTVLSLLTYELSLNPGIQQKLMDEIDGTERELDGKRISYETLQQMKYMDQVVSEGLRKWPVTGLVDRYCVSDYVCELDNGVQYHFEKGVGFMVPIYGFHHDSKYFPQPEQFDPERFSDENKHKIVPGTYIPFGIGPRNCIGSRFALMEIKAILYYILLNFTLEPNAKTQIPLQFKKSPFSVQFESGLHLTFNPREERISQEESD